MKSFSLDFRVRIGKNMFEVFDEMKNFQQAGIADKDSCLVLNDIRVPAGFLENGEQCCAMHEAIINGDLKQLEDIVANVADLTDNELTLIAATCLSGMDKCGSRAFDAGYVGNFVDTISSKKRGQIQNLFL